MEAKFRVLDKLRGVFLNPKNFCWDQTCDGIPRSGESGELLVDFEGNLRIATFSCGNGDNSADSVFDKVPMDNYVIQRYIGQQDINGHDIYEGDILEYSERVGMDKETVSGQVEFVSEVSSFQVKTENGILRGRDLRECQIISKKYHE